MRIIGGKWRGRVLDAPPGKLTRPTSDRTREALFSMLASRIGSFEDLRVADLFAGSGALGFEALSRGAARACFVENDPLATAKIRLNADKLGAQIDLITSSALSLPQREGFDLVFADPPYMDGSGTQVVRSVVTANWLAHGGWMSVETAQGDDVDPAGLVIDAIRKFGRSQITLLRRP